MLKVIIADDERLICRLVQTLADWDSMGMEVVAMAENGLEALELVQSRHPDILDYRHTYAWLRRAGADTERETNHAGPGSGDHQRLCPF